MGSSFKASVACCTQDWLHCVATMHLMCTGSQASLYAANIPEGLAVCLPAASSLLPDSLLFFVPCLEFICYRRQPALLFSCSRHSQLTVAGNIHKLSIQFCPWGSLHFSPVSPFYGLPKEQARTQGSARPSHLESSRVGQQRTYTASRALSHRVSLLRTKFD